MVKESNTSSTVMMGIAEVLVFHFLHSLKFHTAFLFHWFCLVI